MRKLRMPRLDVAMDSGSIVEWLKEEGEKVEEGEPLVEVMSEKVTFEVPSPISGVLYKRLIGEDEEVPVGQVIGVITEEGDDLKFVEGEVEKIRVEAKESEVAEAETAHARTVSASKPSEDIRRLKISPIARRLAEEMNVDTSRLTGSGPDGRIVKEDVLRAAERLESSSVLKEGLTVEEVIPLKGVRKLIAEHMVSSYTTAPHVTITMEVNVTETSKLRDRLVENRRLSFNTFFIKAAVKALQDYPILNSRLEEEEILIFKEINVSVAVDTEEGLIVPVIRNADKKHLEALDEELRDIVKRARENKLSLGDVTGGTFTITNLGMFDVEAFTPIITPGQTAIMGIGRISEKQEVSGGEVRTLNKVILSLSFDHRVVDGAQAARFLQRVKEHLESPSTLTKP